MVTSIVGSVVMLVAGSELGSLGGSTEVTVLAVSTVGSVETLVVGSVDDLIFG